MISCKSSVCALSTKWHTEGWPRSKCVSTKLKISWDEDLWRYNWAHQYIQLLFILCLYRGSSQEQHYKITILFPDDNAVINDDENHQNNHLTWVSYLVSVFLQTQTRKYVREEINNLEPSNWVCNFLMQGYTYIGVGNQFHPAITEAEKPVLLSTQKMSSKFISVCKTKLWLGYHVGTRKPRHDYGPTLLWQLFLPATS
jgi:hypothetical protein